MASYLVEVVPSVLTLFVNETLKAKIVHNTSKVEIQKSIDIADSYIEDDYIIVKGLKLGSAFINIAGYDENGDYVYGDSLTVNVVKDEIVIDILDYKPSIDYFKMMFPLFEYETVITDSNTANFDNTVYDNADINQTITDKYLAMLIDEVYLMVRQYLLSNGYEEPNESNMGAIQPLKDYICYLVAYKLCFRQAVTSDLIIRIDTERNRILEELKIVLSKKTKSSYKSVQLNGEIKKP